MQNNQQNNALEAFYDKGGVMPADKPLAPLESRFCAELADATGNTLTDVVNCYKYVKSFDDTAKICELARLNNVLVSDLVEAAKAGEPEPGPAAVQVEIKATKNSINLEFNGRFQYLVFTFSGAKQLAENLLAIVKAQKEQNRNGLYVQKPNIIL